MPSFQKIIDILSNAFSILIFPILFPVVLHWVSFCLTFIIITMSSLYETYPCNYCLRNIFGIHLRTFFFLDNRETDSKNSSKYR